MTAWLNIQDDLQKVVSVLIFLTIWWIRYYKCAPHKIQLKLMKTVFEMKFAKSSWSWQESKESTETNNTVKEEVLGGKRALKFAFVKKHFSCSFMRWSVRCSDWGGSGGWGARMTWFVMLMGPADKRHMLRPRGKAAGWSGGQKQEWGEGLGRSLWWNFKRKGGAGQAERLRVS